MVSIDKDPAVGFNAAVAEELRAERAAQKATIATIAAEAGVSDRTVIRMLHGERHITVESLIAIAGALGLRASDVMAAAERRMARNAGGVRSTWPPCTTVGPSLVNQSAQRQEAPTARGGGLSERQ